MSQPGYGILDGDVFVFKNFFSDNAVNTSDLSYSEFRISNSG
ncbi:MAG TPA: hypothetical protein VIM85_04495 [Pseudomonadales bacterium]